MRGAPENEPQEPQFPQPRHWMSFRSWRGPPDGLCEALPRARKGSTSATVARRRPDGQGFACASSTLRRGGRVVEGAQVAFGDRP